MASLTALVIPAGVAGAAVTLGQPQAEAAYGEAIDFSVPVTGPTPPERAELRLLFPGALGPYVIDVPVAGAGDGQTLRYRLDLTGGGHLSPNTTIRATWAVYPTADGEPVLSEERVVRYLDTTHDWQTVEGDLVRVHWYAGDQAFADKALQIGERAVRETADLLGVTESEPIDFYIYGDGTSFREALGPGTREWVGGRSVDEIRTLFALITPDAIDDPWVATVVPHEIVHLVFNTAVDNPFREPPLWLNEGLAMYLAEGYSEDSRLRVERAARTDELIPFTALAGSFPTESDRASLAYAEAASAVDHLVRTKGTEPLLALVTSYADGLTDDEAFTRAVGTDLAGFQAGWLAELGAAEPRQYGPRPNLPGPLPSGWGAPSSAGPEEGARATPGGAPWLVAAVAVVVAAVAVGLVVARRRRERLS